MKSHALRIAACACWLALFAAPSLSTAQSPKETPPPEFARAEGVVLTATVTDESGRHVTGLGKESFTVIEGKTTREITLFRDVGDEPMSIALIFDVSRSMRASRELLPAAKAAAARLVSWSNESNEYLVAEFGGEGGLRVLTDWTRDRAALAAGFDKIATANSEGGKPKPRGLTYWRDACADALDRFGAASLPRRAVILLGDAGHDLGSRTGDDELKRRVRKSGLLFYVIAHFSTQLTPTLDAQLSLDTLAEATGGRAFFTTTAAELKGAVDRLVLEFRHQYVVGFVPSNAATEGKWSKAEIKVTKPQGWRGAVRVRSPGGYFSRGATGAVSRP